MALVILFAVLFIVSFLRLGSVSHQIKDLADQAEKQKKIVKEMAGSVELAFLEAKMCKNKNKAKILQSDAEKQRLEYEKTNEELKSTKPVVENGIKKVNKYFCVTVFFLFCFFVSLCFYTLRVTKQKKSKYLHR